MPNQEVRVLVIQDEKKDREVINVALRSENQILFRVEYISTVEEGLKILGKGDVDLILLDLFLADSKGLETFDRVYARSPEVPTVVLSDAEDEKLAFQVVKKGAQDYLARGKVYDKVILRVVRYAIERKRAEEKIRQSEKLYRTLAGNLPGVAVLLFDGNFRFKIAEGMALGDLGTSKEKLEGKTLWEAFPSESCAKLEPYFRKGVRGEPSSFEWETGGRSYLCHALPVSDEGGAGAAMAMAVDITARKQLEEMKDEFVNSVSHELRTPLAMIKEGVSQVLDGTLGVITQDQKQFLNITYENINRLSRIINELLDISKIEAGKIELKRELADITEIARNSTLMFKTHAERLGIELKESYSRPKIEMYIDKDRITQVFTNLIGNALKFTEKGRVEISITDFEDRVECSVADTGKGIAESDLKQVFSKFRQFMREPGPGAQGTGLGLAITKGLVELHKGEIVAESAILKGSRFTFKLPKFEARKLFKETLDGLITDSERSKEPFTVLYFDLANFEELSKHLGGKDLTEGLVNDIERVIRKSLRRSADRTIVKDGRSVLVILPQTDKEKALMAAGRLSQVCEDQFSKAGLYDIARLTCNVAAYPVDASSEEEFMRRALW